MKDNEKQMDFYPLSLQTGLLVDLSDDAQAYPLRVFGCHDDTLDLPENATHYGMITEGGGILTNRNDRFRLRAGMFFVMPGACRLAAPGGRGLVISRMGYRGLRQVGGPIEKGGRLRYIDGCTDTLLVCPPRLGEPCLNHLHIPPHTAQSEHTHPSERIGVILRGRGECRVSGPKRFAHISPFGGYGVAHTDRSAPCFFYHGRPAGCDCLASRLGLRPDR